MHLNLFITALIGVALLSCAHAKPPPGANEIIRAPLSNATGLEAIVADVVIPANAALAAHSHPGQEFLYLIEGSTTLIEDGQAERVLKAGESYVIPAGTIHAAKSGPQGTRAIVFRVHAEGAPISIPAAPAADKAATKE